VIGRFASPHDHHKWREDKSGSWWYQVPAWCAAPHYGAARDLDRFFTALADGRLLQPSEFAAMRTTVPVPQDRSHPEGTGDGLELFLNPLSCGGGYLGHRVSGFGHVIRAAATTDGRRTVSAHSRSADPQTAARQEDALRNLIDHTLRHTT
jgi:D-alanyl-D-alanine carboxypeptidase